MTDRNGNALTLAYDGPRVMAVTDSMGRTVNLRYGADGRLAALADFYDPAAPRTVAFEYSPEGDLVLVCDPLGHTTRYTYAQGQPLPWLEHDLLTVVDGKGQTYVAVTYDADTDRVLAERYGDAAQVYRFQYAANLGGGVRTVCAP